jgi:hypothetical protein
MKLVPTDQRIFISWFVYVDGKKMLKKENVKYPGCKYDVACSCGWESATGGSNKDVLYGHINHHKLSVHNYQFELNCGCVTDFISNTKHTQKCKLNLYKMATVNA